jgi:hypothetical protein
VQREPGVFRAAARPERLASSAENFLDANTFVVESTAKFSACFDALARTEEA